MIRIRATVLALSALLVVILTVVSYRSLGEFIFDRGSLLFLEVRLPMVTVLSVGVCAVLVSCLGLWVKRNAVFYLILVVSMLAWVIAGRVVARSPDGELALGWLCFRTNTTQLLEPGEEYATAWRLHRLPAWRFELRRDDGRVERLFVGPGLMSESAELLAKWGVRVSGEQGGEAPRGL